MFHEDSILFVEVRSRASFVNLTKCFVVGFTFAASVLPACWFGTYVWNFPFGLNGDRGNRRCPEIYSHNELIEYIVGHVTPSVYSWPRMLCWTWF